MGKDRIITKAVNVAEITNETKTKEKTIKLTIIKIKINPDKYFKEIEIIGYKLNPEEKCPECENELEEIVKRLLYEIIESKK